MGDSAGSGRALRYGGDFPYFVELGRNFDPELARRFAEVAKDQGGDS